MVVWKTFWPSSKAQPGWMLYNVTCLEKKNPPSKATSFGLCQSIKYDMPDRQMDITLAISLFLSSSKCRFGGNSYILAILSWRRKFRSVSQICNLAFSADALIKALVISFLVQWQYSFSSRYLLASSCLKKILAQK